MGSVHLRSVFWAGLAIAAAGSAAAEPIGKTQDVTITACGVTVTTAASTPVTISVGECHATVQLGPGLSAVVKTPSPTPDEGRSTVDKTSLDSWAYDPNRKSGVLAGASRRSLNWTDGGNPPERSQGEIIRIATGQPPAKPPPNPPNPPNPPDSGSSNAKDFFVGAGLAVSYNIGSRRADSVKFIQRTDGQVFAQVQNSQDENIGLFLEAHYLFKNMFIHDDVYKDNKNTPCNIGTGCTKGPFDYAADLLACGPWAFFNDDTNTSGCGLLFLANIASSQAATVNQFGAGWAIGLGPANSPKDIGLGLGVLVDPSDKVVDSNLIDENTLIAKPQYQAGLLNGTINPLVSRPTFGVFFMLSKALN